MYRVAFVVSLLLAAAIVPANAQYGFGLYRAGVDITDADMQVIRETVRAVLDTETVGTSQSFSVPETSLSGEVTLNEYYAEEDTHCAQVAILVSSGGRQAPFDLLLCQRPDGTWGIAG